MEATSDNRHGAAERGRQPGGCSESAPFESLLGRLRRSAERHADAIAVDDGTAVISDASVDAPFPVLRTATVVAASSSSSSPWLIIKRVLNVDDDDGHQCRRGGYARELTTELVSSVCDLSLSHHHHHHLPLSHVLCVKNSRINMLTHTG